MGGLVLFVLTPPVLLLNGLVVSLLLLLLSRLYDSLHTFTRQFPLILSLSPQISYECLTLCGKLLPSFLYLHITLCATLSLSHKLQYLLYSRSQTPFFPSRCLFLSTPMSDESSTRSPTSSAATMKDTSSSSISRHSRNTVYSRKRPSPHGVSKSHYKTPLLSQNPNRKTPRSARTTILQQQRLREAQLIALRREGVIIEEEYREEIRRYMHDMEVSAPNPTFS